MKVISEGPIRITKATIDAAWRRRSTDRRLLIRDLECRGLALIVNATAMTWSYAYRPRGTDSVTGRRWPNRTLTLGNPATHSPDDARGEANRVKGQAAAGGDPVADRKARAAEDRRKRGATLKRLLDDYALALPRRPKMRGVGLPSPEYVDDEIAHTRQALADMNAADMPTADLTEANVRGLLGTPGGVTTARKRFGALSRFLDWCQDAGHIQSNPCALIARSRRPRAVQPRSHYLTGAEMARLWKAADELREPVWRDLARFLIAIPCRRGEAIRLDWAHLDLSASEWRQPAHMTKNREPHRLHIHDLARKVLADRRAAHALFEAKGDPEKAARVIAAGQPRSGLVFPAPVSGRSVDTFSDIKNALTTATGPMDGEESDPPVEGWTWHDFRRSFVTALAESGIPEAIADAMLNHRQTATRGGVLGVYQRSSRWPEQVRAMELWGRLLATEIKGEETSESEAAESEQRRA